MDKAAAALEAKSDQKGVQGKKPVVGNKEKKAVGDKKLKKPVVGKKAAGTKKPTIFTLFACISLADVTTCVLICSRLCICFL